MHQSLNKKKFFIFKTVTLDLYNYNTREKLI
jgi:hypothetical protein